MKAIILLFMTFTALAQTPKDWKTNKPIKDLKSILSPLQYEVTQKEGTEKPFKNKYWNHHEEGIYVDTVSGEPLFSSLDKYDSGTGWPSFTKPIEGIEVETKEDKSLFMSRTEVHSKMGNSHLGHVFDDGPGVDGKRFCINSASLRFIATEDLDKEGYGQYKKLFKKKEIRKEKKMKFAYLAGGCFWGMEKYLRTLPGVIDTEVGYIGGASEVASYTDVKTGTTGHAESVRVEYDPTKLSYQNLIRFFFRIHDPTTLNRQGNDIGTQYRSAVFTNDSEEKKAIEELIQKINDSKVYEDKVATRIEAFQSFFSAEDYHQDYLEKHPNGYNCHLLRPDFPFK